MLYRTNLKKHIFPCVAAPDPGSGAFLTHGSGMDKKTGSRIRDEQPESYFREIRNQFFWLKYLSYLMRIRDRKKIRIRDLRWKNSDTGSRINVRNPG
jgi:hypothetical protein